METKYILILTRCNDGICYKIIEGEVEFVEGNFCLIKSTEGDFYIQVTQTYSSYDQACAEAKYLLSLYYGKEI